MAQVLSVDWLRGMQEHFEKVAYDQDMMGSEYMLTHFIQHVMESHAHHLSLDDIFCLASLADQVSKWAVKMCMQQCLIHQLIKKLLTASVCQGLC